MTRAAINLPDDIDDGTWKEKGRVGGVRLEHQHCHYVLTFYDIARLQQDVRSDVDLNGYFLEPNVVIVESIDRHHIETAIHNMIERGWLRMLLPEKIGG